MFRQFKSVAFALLAALGCGFSSVALADPSITVTKLAESSASEKQTLKITYSVSGLADGTKGDYYIVFSVKSGDGKTYSPAPSAFSATAVKLLTQVTNTVSQTVTWKCEEQLGAGVFQCDGCTVSAELKYLKGSSGNNTPYATDHQYVVVDLSKGPSASSYSVTTQSWMTITAATNEYQKATYKQNKLVLRRLRKGTFKMGSPTGEASTYREPGFCHKETQHNVKLTHDFLIGVYETTQRQYTNVVKTTFQKATASNYNVSRGATRLGDATAASGLSYAMLRGGEGLNQKNLKADGTSPVGGSTFFGKLRNRAKFNFDLPTEAQWEYAIREEGKRTGITYFSADTATGVPNAAVLGKYAVYSSDGILNADVGTKLPNNLGLYDMLGGVWELTLDRVKNPTTDQQDPGSNDVTDPVQKFSPCVVHRGSGFEQDAADASARSYFRSALRGGDSTTNRTHAAIGFRVAATLPTDAPDFVVDSGTPKAFAKLSVLPDDCDGWYTIAGIRPENLAAGTYVVQTNTYPWYSGKNWMTNVYNTVKTDWQNCGGIISNAGALGAPYTNQLVVTIFPKDAGKKLDISYKDMPRDVTETHGLHTGNTHAQYLFNANASPESALKYTTFRFSNCDFTEELPEYHAVVGGKEVPLQLQYAVCEPCNDGIVFEFESCDLAKTLLAVQANNDGGDSKQHTANYTYINCNISAPKIQGSNTVGDLLCINSSVQSNFMFNCVFLCMEWGIGMENSMIDAYHGTTDCIVTNVEWSAVAPGQQLAVFNRPCNLKFGDIRSGDRVVDLCLENYDKQGILVAPVTNYIDLDKSKSDTLNYLITVHGHEVKFVYSDEVDDPEANVVTNYSLHGDAPKDNLLWTAKSKTYDELLRTDHAPEVEPGLAWVDADGNEFDPEKSITGDIVYHLKGTPIALKSLHIQSFAQATNETDGSFVYLAVRATFDSDISPAAFGKWLAKVKGGSAGGNFVAKTSADGKDFDYAESVSMESDGPHPYDADKDDMLVWLKVKLADVTTVKYWKIAFVKTTTE